MYEAGLSQHERGALLQKHNPPKKACSPMTPVFSKLELIRLPRLTELLRLECPPSPLIILFFCICGVSCRGSASDVSRIVLPRECGGLDDRDDEGCVIGVWPFVGGGGNWNAGFMVPDEEAASAARERCRREFVSDCI